MKDPTPIEPRLWPESDEHTGLERARNIVDENMELEVGNVGCGTKSIKDSVYYARKVGKVPNDRNPAVAG